MKKKIVFIMNPISGTASKASIPNLIDSILDKDRFEYEIRTTERAGHASEIASEAKEAHVDIVVAVGGDGTVRHSPGNSALWIGQRTGSSPHAAHEPEKEY